MMFKSDLPQNEFKPGFVLMSLFLGFTGQYSIEVIVWVQKMSMLVCSRGVVVLCTEK